MNRRAAIPEEILRLVEYRPAPDTMRQPWEVGPGDKNWGRSGVQIGTLGFKRHHGDPAVVLRMDDTGRAESFSPMQLFPGKKRAEGAEAQDEEHPDEVRIPVSVEHVQPPRRARR